MKQAPSLPQFPSILVAPYAGAWIETPHNSGINQTPLVAPYAGAWIETVDRMPLPTCLPSRPLRGGVD